MQVATETNSIGAYRLCGIPTDLAGVEVTAGEGWDRVSAAAALSEDKPVVTITLELVREPRDSARIVRADNTGPGSLQRVAEFNMALSPRSRSRWR